MVEEVLLAERVGFDAFGSSEQHVALGTASVSAPEVLYPYLMALTSRIRFIHLVTLLPTRMNHALRVAERVATEDILSNGRVELGTGRGNTTLALRAFEVDPSENKSQWREGVELIRRAFLDDPCCLHRICRDARKRHRDLADLGARSPRKLRSHRDGRVSHRSFRPAVPSSGLHRQGIPGPTVPGESRGRWRNAAPRAPALRRILAQPGGDRGCFPGWLVPYR
ncbi:LLM class flavin-dependent oxidoreductase [Streptomyces sp. NPDC056669]|uniref:LLM class flavin-dependent oxidoreductase n=1 Tax=Streptomyces sp. NPDC056669 TaxID=3345903 RepID=UPI00368DEA21